LPCREDDYEWLGRWADFADAITEALLPVGGHAARVLVVGCGNSSFSSDMHKCGFTNMTSIDFSAVVIDKMKTRHPEMDWRVMDMLDMAELSGGSYDAIVDKAAMDALVTDGE
jgi:2-polyprenyl-3-methyl-5-hydroxy-6-metoxy-1,4-benzoquinol methylase